MKKLLLLAIVVLGISAVSFGQSKIGSANTEAYIITPLSINKVEGGDLKFGNIISGDNAGTVKVKPEEGTGTSIADYTNVKAPDAFAGNIQAAKFEISGENGAKFSITPGAAFVVSAGTGKDMDVTGVTASPASGVLGETPTTIYVGATLSVAKDQASGSYSNVGGLKITVNYE